MRLALAALPLAALFVSVASADEIAQTVASKIARVTVYEDRALVTRGAKASLGLGVTRLVFEHLPVGLDAASIRARCGAARVLGVDLETVNLSREGREDVQRARVAHEASRRRLSAAEMELAEAKDRWDLFRSIRAKSLEGAERALGGGPGVDVKSMGDVLDLVGRQGAEARRAVLAATEAVEAARREEEAAKKTLEMLQTGRDRTESRVLVTLQADAAAEADVSLQYIVGNASWRPVYDLRVDEDFGGSSLGLSGFVVQRTGEDWKDVALELTTAQPSRGAAPPEPMPWRIGFPRPMAEGTARQAAAPPAAKAALAAGDEREDAPKDKEFAPIVRRSGLVVAFQAQTSESVASDGQPSRVSLARFDLKPEVRWTAFPRATDKVFVTAKMTNTTTAALPAGDCRVFVGPDFVGPLQLRDWGIGKELDVGLGVDREVEVDREQLQDERSTSGIFTKDTVTARSYRLAVTNRRARPINVRLLDQVPVSNDEDLVVKLGETSLPLASLPAREAETNKARGVLEWRFPLAAKASKDVRFAFEVTHPKGREAFGL